MLKKIYTLSAVFLGLFVGVMLVSAVYTADQSPATSWQIYENERFQYQLELPKSFTSREAPQNNDGREFMSSSGSTTVRVYGRNNTNNASVSDLVSEQTQQLNSLRDAHIGSSSAIMYGTREGVQKTVKLLRGQDRLAFVEILNPRSALSQTQEKQLLDSLRWSQPRTDNEDSPQATTTDERPISYTPDTAADMIQVETPTQAATITPPLDITGEARGQWFFEADAPVVLTDWNGEIIAEGYIQAEGEWMTEEFVPFSGSLEFAVPEDTGPQSVRGSLIIQRANPPGQPENDMAVEIPVRFNR
jgi:hypothetical protein